MAIRGTKRVFRHTRRESKQGIKNATEGETIGLTASVNLS